MVKMIEQMGEAQSNEVATVSSDKNWPPKAAPREMQKQMGEDRGDIAALLSGGRYDPSTFAGEGKDVTANEPSAYNVDKTPRVPGGTAGFKAVPDKFEPVRPYPEIPEIYEHEPLGAGFQPRDVVPVRETPGNSQIVGDLVTGKPEDGQFSGPAKIGPGDMIADFERGEQTNPRAEDTFEAPLVGDLIPGMPTDDYPREEDLATEVAPESLITGKVKGGYAVPGIGGQGKDVSNPHEGGSHGRS